MGFGPLSVILWDKNDKIAFQRNRPKIMEIEKNRKKSKKYFFFKNVRNWSLMPPLTFQMVANIHWDTENPFLHIFEKKYFFDFFFDFFRFSKKCP